MMTAGIMRDNVLLVIVRMRWDGFNITGIDDGKSMLRVVADVV